MDVVCTSNFWSGLLFNSEKLKQNLNTAPSPMKHQKEKKKKEFETQKKSAPAMNPKIRGADFMNWVRQKAGST